MLLAKTHFPSFTFDSLNHFVSSSTPELDDTSCSSDEEADLKIKQKCERYQTKEDQDVAVFMGIANRMDLSSLVFILQGHAKAMNLPAAAQQQAAQRISGQTKPQAVKKQFRFALNHQQNVRCVVHVIPSIKDEHSLWWSDDDMKQIRSLAIQDVKYYRKYRRDFAQNVEILASATPPSTDNSGNSNNAALASKNARLVENTMKAFLNDGYARGLEVHIVNLLSDLRRETVKAVIEEQNECRMCGDSPDITAESLREQSLAYSTQSRTFALKMAQCDQIEALKASLSSRWEAEGPSATKKAFQI